MKKIITSFILYPFYAKLAVVLVIIAGSLSFFNMKKSFQPEMSTREIYVEVRYPGASPKEMEEGVTTRVEEAVRSIVGIREITSSSAEDLARIVIVTTGQYDLDDTLMEVKNAVDGISSFPTDAERPVVYKQRAVTRAMFLALSGAADLLTLKKYATQIESDMRASGFVSQISISGLPALEISVEVSEENLLRYTLTFDEISAAITRNNRDISAGMIKSADEEIQIRTRSRSVDPNTIGAIPLRAGADGGFIRIRDIGTVKMKFADVTNKFFHNGHQAVSFNISKLSEEDLEIISNYVRNYVTEFNRRNPSVKLDITFDYLAMLNNRLNLLYDNGFQGLILVVLCLGFFLSLRLSFWVAWGIPASFLAMFVVANLAGVTINMMSLFGMILVVGILVDNGIVISENIHTCFEKGQSPHRAAIEGAMEVLPAVAASVATTIIAFIPLLLLQGRMEMMKEVAFVVIFSLIFSLLEAAFILPAFVGSASILRHRRQIRYGRKGREIMEKAVIFLRYTLYGDFLKKIIRWRWIMAIIPIAMALITIGLFRGEQIGVTFFPPIQFDFFFAEVAFKPGSGSQHTLDTLLRFEKAAWKVNQELKDKYHESRDFVRFTSLNLGNAFNNQELGSHAGNIRVTLRDMEGSPVSSYEIANRVREAIGPVSGAEKMTVGSQNPRFGKPIALSLMGNDLQALEGAAALMKENLRKITAIGDVADNNAVGMREIRLTLKPKAFFLGLDYSSISNQVRQGFFGGQAQRLQSGKDEIRVWVRYPKAGRTYVGQLEDIKIKTPKGFFPLSELADFRVDRGPVSINHYNLSREIRIEADLVDPYTPVPPIIAHIENNILPEIQTRFPGVRSTYQGQQRESADSMRDLIRYFAIALGVIIIILMIHFKSFWQMFIIFLMIPMSWLAASWGHLIEGIPISVFSILGMAALSGVVISNTIVFLAKFNSNLTDGMNVAEAVYDAGVSRFRAIILTSVTTVAGLYPLVLEKSFQAQYLKPMAIALAYGVFFGIFFILLCFPAFIMALNDIKRLIRRLFTGEIPDPRDVEPAVTHSLSSID